MRITYWGHSGFSVGIDGRSFLFDYIGHALTQPEKQEKTTALISHAHADHCSQEVLRWGREGRVRLVAGMGVPAGCGSRLRPGACESLGDATVRAFGSTDAGVSFLLECGGWSVFHAGDFNLWHWRSEADAAWLRKAEQEFEGVLHTLRGLRMDVAFFPVDPRMGDGYDEGALRFAEAVRPGTIIPMHFWDRPDAARSFAEKCMPEGVRAVCLTRTGETLEIGSL